MQIVNLVLGGALLIWGRRMYYLFIAAAGFVAGVSLGAQYVPIPWWASYAVGGVFAIVAFALASFIKDIAPMLGGFLMGGYVMTALGQALGFSYGPMYIGLFLVGGVAGAILLSLFFNLALIWLSAIAGVLLIQDVLPLTGVVKTLVLVVILFIGVGIQVNFWGGDDDED
jgi:hypothetical protein